jgi:hypothetical protein
MFSFRICDCLILATSAQFLLPMFYKKNPYRLSINKKIIIVICITRLENAILSASTVCGADASAEPPQVRALAKHFLVV